MSAEFDKICEQPFLKIRSSLSSQRMQSTLLKGTCLAAIGVLLIVATGTLMPIGILNVYGLLFYAIGCGLITAGLLPYRKLCALEKSPHEISISNEGQLTYSTKRRCIFSVALASIEAVSFSESPTGMVITLKQPMPEKVVIYDPYFAKLYRERDHSLFLADFSKRACQELLDAMDQGQ